MLLRFLHLIAAMLAVGLGACTIEMPSDPNRYSLEPNAAAHLRGPQSVALVNGYPGESKVRMRLGGTTLVFDQKQMTDTAIAMLGRSLQPQGITDAPQAPKTVTLRVTPTRLRVHGIAPFPQRTATLRMEVSFGDGTSDTLQAENSSPADFDRLLDGAILFALQALLTNEKFVAYLNR